jgi:hypothetical protein
MREERMALSKQSMYTEANMAAIQKINEMKGELTVKERKLTSLQSEASSLRNVKNNQNSELEKQSAIKNFPSKIKEISEEIKAMKEKEKYIDEQIKWVDGKKTQNFEDIIIMEDELKLLRARKKKEDQFKKMQREGKH